MHFAIPLISIIIHLHTKITHVFFKKKQKSIDDDGREFCIRVVSGRFDYSMIPGDDIEYDLLSGKVTQIGDVEIDYNLVSGRVEKVGDVRIRYQLSTGKRKVKEVGGLKINYDLFGKIKGTRGQVR
jgi:hypothetical protein